LADENDRQQVGPARMEQPDVTRHWLMKDAVAGLSDYIQIETIRNSAGREYYLVVGRSTPPYG
jgi:hypothetical protein